MASLDKTYITSDDYINYRTWWIDNYDKMLYELGYAIYLYPFMVLPDELEVTPNVLKVQSLDVDYANNSSGYFPIWNTSNEEDIWLIKNCN